MLQPLNDKTIIAGFEQWLVEQDPKAKYNYMDSSGCAFAQYLKSLGFPHPSVVPSRFWYDRHDDYDQGYNLPKIIEKAVHGGHDEVDDFDRWTFGAALKRLRQLKLEA